MLGVESQAFTVLAECLEQQLDRGLQPGIYYSKALVRGETIENRIRPAFVTDAARWLDAETKGVSGEVGGIEIDPGEVQVETGKGTEINGVQVE